MSFGQFRYNEDRTELRITADETHPMFHCWHDCLGQGGCITDLIGQEAWKPISYENGEFYFERHTGQA